VTAVGRLRLFGIGPRSAISRHSRLLIAGRSNVGLDPNYGPSCSECARQVVPTIGSINFRLIRAFLSTSRHLIQVALPQQNPHMDSSALIEINGCPGVAVLGVNARGSDELGAVYLDCR
jgi:hypothetical protein